MDDEETVEGVVCFGVAIPGRRPGEGPYAASITLLKVRATDERVPALVDDLRLLASRMSDPLHVERRRDAGAGRSEPVDAGRRRRRTPRRARRGRQAVRAALASCRRPARSVAASRQTGQSEPNSSRSGPNTSSAWSTYGRRSAGVHDGPVGLGDHARRPCRRRGRGRRNGAISDAHGSSAPVAIGGFATWSMTNRTSGSAPGEVEGRRQLARPDEEVVGEARRADGRDPADDVVAGQPVRVGLVVDLVADPDEAARRPGRPRSAAIGVADAGIGQVDPADDAADERRRRRRSRGSRSVSSRLERVWTRTVASTPVARGGGARSSGPNARRIGGELVGQPRVVGGRPGPRSGGGRRRSRLAASGRRRGVGPRGGPRRGARPRGRPGSRSAKRRVLVEMGRRPDAGDERRRPPDGRAGTGRPPPAAGRRGARRPRRAAAPARRSPAARRVVEPAARRPGSARMPLFITPPIEHADAALDGRPAAARRAPPGRGACSGRRAGRRRCRSRGRTGRASPTGSCPAPMARITPSSRSRARAGYASSIAACQ